MKIKDTKERKFFNSLQVFRGVAALMVVFHHEWIAFTHFHSANSLGLNFLGGLGKYGVDFFFVLSGFIITYSNYDKAGSLSETKTYFLNRVLRIYLPYLPISILMLALYFFFPGTSEGRDRDINLLTSLTLIPVGKPALSVAWTLVHEMLFYLLFISWFISKKAWYYLLAIWATIIICLNFIFNYHEWRSNFFFNYLFSFYNLEFILGFFSAILLRRIKNISNQLYLIPGILFIAVVFLVKWQHREETTTSPGINLLLSTGFLFLILGSVRSRLDNLGKGNVLMILGNASYSIYLIHNLCISIFMRLFIKFGSIPKPVVFLSVFFICCLAGVLYSKLFEEYLLRKAKSRLQPVGATRRVQAVSKVE